MHSHERILKADSHTMHSGAGAVMKEYTSQKLSRNVPVWVQAMSSHDDKSKASAQDIIATPLGMPGHAQTCAPPRASVTWTGHP